jgi:hypothetical protein
MRNLLGLFLLALCSVASAEPTIHELLPAAGFPWGGTRVNIQGADLLGEPFLSCYGSAPCPITVLFGDVPGDVESAAPSHVTVIAPAHARGVTDVTIKVVGRPDAYLANAFTFTDLADEFGSGEWTAFFIPVNANDVNGAHGSIWRTELTVHNPTEFTVPLDGVLCEQNDPSPCPRLSLAPGETKSIRLYPGRGEGATLIVPNGIADELSMSLRVRDLSRNAEDWGTEVPIVQREQFVYVHRLLDIPTDPRYRVLLRTFGGWRTIVRVYPLSGNDVLDELHFERDLNGDTVMVDPITPAVRSSGHERVRVLVEFQSGPLDDPPSGGWAFVSLTNNQTQHVTIISPQK